VDTQPKPSEIVIMVSGLVALISAFLAWYTAPAGFGNDANAFDNGLFPIALYIPLIGLAMGLHIALSKFANVNFPERILGFSWPQIHLALGIFAVLLGLGYLIIDNGADKGIGLWLAVLASIGLVVGAVLLNNEENTTSHSAGSVPPSPF
jgi:peptidoglycan/LPS O-acetylase OafA/YrhL